MFIKIEDYSQGIDVMYSFPAIRDNTVQEEDDLFNN